MKGGREKWVRFGPGEAAYKVAAHLCFATEAAATMRWQKATRGGGGGTATPLPHTGRRGGQPDPNPQTHRGRRGACHRVRARGPWHRVRACGIAMGSAKDALDTQALCVPQSSREL